MDFRLPSNALVVASHNPGKAREIAELLAPLGVTIKTASDLKLPKPAETGTTFRANAELKAKAAAKASGLAALADDSGLVVPALGSQPGIYSARWAGPKKDFSIAMKRVWDELGGKNTAAHFICALALALPSGEVHAFEGRAEGQLVWPPRGDKGFGYDPMFVPEGYAVTFGELAPAEKHAISHRGKAFAKFREFLLS
jgi:XTP/dITP diphosphohydrolase